MIKRKCNDCLHKPVCKIYTDLKNVFGGLEHNKAIQAHANEFADRCEQYLVLKEGSLEADLLTLQEVTQTLKWSAAMFDINPHNGRRVMEIEITDKNENWIQKFNDQLKRAIKKLEAVTTTK